MNFVFLAIPLFLALILVELWFDYRKQSRTFSFNDSINSLNLGILSQLTGLAKKTLQFSIYLIVFNQFALFDLGTSSAIIWILGFIAYDFCYYWQHRMSHEINVLWASHVVHHQSEEYNLTTALRQTSGNIFSFLFYLPLAIIGIDPIIIISVGSLNLVYQFWVHTKHVNKMPNWYEAIFITPSNHRVHHAQNPIYLDKNHGGVFVIWDRLFGSYQAELDHEPVIFGVTKPLASWNPVWANLEVYWGLIKDAYRTQSWRDKLLIWVKPTGWRPEDVASKYPSPVFDPYQQVKYDSPLSLMQKCYVLFQHVSLIAFTLFILISANDLAVSSIYIATLGLTTYLFFMGMFQEQARGAYALQYLNLAICFMAILYTFSFSSLSIIAASSWLVTGFLLLTISYKETNTLQTIKQ